MSKASSAARGRRAERLPIGREIKWGAFRGLRKFESPSELPAGYADMLLWVADGNVNAERLYVRNGFGRTGADQEMRPEQLEYEMSRRL